MKTFGELKNYFVNNRGTDYYENGIYIQIYHGDSIQAAVKPNNCEFPVLKFEMRYNTPERFTVGVALNKETYDIKYRTNITYPLTDNLTKIIDDYPGYGHIIDAIAGLLKI